MKTLTKEITRGDQWAFSVGFTFTGHDFTGATVSCVFRQSVGSDVVATLTGTVTTPSAGRAVAVFSVEGTDTIDWPVGSLVGEVKIVQSGASFGPYRPGRIALTVLEQINP